jgi:antitoxin (DNA-binding transcriptional repressor) of toxin-antitoxin stability system
MSSSLVYTVHMKRVTATEARKNWFRLLDEVLEGEVVLIERDGARLVLKLVDQGEPTERIPDYQALIRVKDVDEADEWGWEWDGSPEGLHPRRTGPQS